MRDFYERMRHYNKMREEANSKIREINESLKVQTEKTTNALDELSQLVKSIPEIK